MFRLTINKNIDIVLIYNGLSKKYYDLINKNRNYLSKWMSWTDTIKSVSDVSSFIKKSLHEYAEDTSLVCAINYNGYFVGNISFNVIDHNLKKVELGYWLDEDYQGHGIITETSKFLISYAFEVLNMEKVQINTATDNLKSQAVCSRLGAVLEGVITNCEKVQDKILSHNIYAIYP